MFHREKLERGGQEVGRFAKGHWGGIGTGHERSSPRSKVFTTRPMSKVQGRRSDFGPAGLWTNAGTGHGTGLVVSPRKARRMRGWKEVGRRVGTRAIESKVQSLRSKVEDQMSAIMTLDFARGLWTDDGTGHVALPEKAPEESPSPDSTELVAGPALSHPKRTRRGGERGTGHVSDRRQAMIGQPLAGGEQDPRRE